jgi:replicative DNA helicase Mcm
MSEFILKSHGKAKQDNPAIPYDLLKAYIMHARKHYNPLVTEKAQKKLQEYYMNLRETSANQQGTISITPRQLEGLIRLTEAHARIALKTQAGEEDAEAAVSMMKVMMAKVCMDTETGEQDIDLLYTGVPHSSQDKLKVIFDVIKSLEGETGMAEESVVYQELEKKGLSEDEAKKNLERLYRQGTIFRPRPGFVKTT